MEKRELAKDEGGARKPPRIPEEFGAQPPSGRGGRAESFDAGKVFHQPWERHGDLFPLPLPVDPWYDGHTSVLGSSRAKQRVARRRKLHADECETVRSLNYLAGFGTEDQWPAQPVNLSQRSALFHVHQAHVQRPAPVEAQSNQAALRQLLSKRAGYSEGPGALATYVREKVSLPQNRGEPVQLSEILPEYERQCLLEFEKEMMLSDEEKAGVLERGIVGLCHTDPLLSNSPKRYHGFVADLYRAGLIRFTISPRVQIGAFFVTKKNGKQRLIIDCRRTNLLFKTPPNTLMGTMETWGRIEVAEDRDLFIAQEDVKDYFYRLGIPERMSEYFCLPAIVPHLLQQELGFVPEGLQVFACDHVAPIYPCMKVLPMGFSWAFHLAHEAHVFVANKELPLVPMIRDKRELQRHGIDSKDASSSMLIYADNCNHLGVDQQQLFSEHSAVIGALGKHGLETHDIVEPATLAESLGVRIDGLGGVVTSTASRDWRLHRAIDALLQGAAISGAEMQVVVGHLTIRAMLHRGLLCILRHVYIFIEQNFDRRKKLWGCVREELWIFKNLMVLGFNDMKAGWDGRLICTDACLSGYAVMEMKESMDTAVGIGRTDERWRFKRSKSRFIPAREHALQGSDVFEDVHTVLPEVEGEVLGDVDLIDDFPEIPAKYMDRSLWYLLWRSRMRFREPVHLIEARSILGAVRHRARDSEKHGKHVVVLNDNMSVVLAMQKGRCSNYGLLRILRRTAAHCFAAGIRLHVRWLPSERNVADEDSRFWEPRGKGDSWKDGTKEARSSSFQQGRSGEKQQEDEFARGHAHQEREKSIEDERDSSTSTSRQKDAWTDQESQEEARKRFAKEEEVCSAAEGKPRGEEFARSCKCESSAEEGLREAARAVLRLCAEVRVTNSERGSARRSLVRVRRPSFLGRGGPEFWPEVAGRNRIRTSRICSGGSSSAASVQEGHERMAKVESSTDKIANARVPEIRNQCCDVAKGLERRSVVQRDNVLDICQARGNTPGYGSRHSGEECRLRSHSDCAGSSGERREFQSGHLRRDTGVGRQQGSMVGHVASEAGKVQAPTRRRGSRAVELQGRDIQGQMERSSFSVGDWRDCRESISESTWRCQPGSHDEVAAYPKHTAEGQMGNRFKHKSVRQARSHAADCESVWRRFQRAGQRDAASLRYLLPEWHQSTSSEFEETAQPDLRGEVFLSLFGGVGECCNFVCHHGGESILVDFSSSKQNDLGKPSRWRDVLTLAAFSTMVGIDLPCNTWSRARRAPWWSKMPSPLRGDNPDNIFGLGGLNQSDFEKVSAANHMVRGALKLIRFCLKRGIPGYLENPLTSRLWKVPAIQQLLRQGKAFFVRADMCQYNTQWRKPTGLLIWHCSLFSMNTCWQKPKCKRTAKPHLQLTGVKNGKFLTHQAQVYTKDFASSLISLITHHKFPPLSH